MLAALEHDVGWDPRTADVIVGSSAGSVTGAALRLGVAASDLAARAAGRAAVAVRRRVLRRHRRRRRAAARAVARRPPARVAPALAPACWPAPRCRPWTVRAGRRRRRPAPGRALRPARAHPRARPRSTSGWPHGLWVCAARRDDGRRVVFGRPGSPVARGSPRRWRRRAPSPATSRRCRSAHASTSTAACTRPPTPTCSCTPASTSSSSCHRCPPPTARRRRADAGDALGRPPPPRGRDPAAARPGHHGGALRAEPGHARRDGHQRDGRRPIGGRRRGRPARDAAAHATVRPLGAPAARPRDVAAPTPPDARPSARGSLRPVDRPDRRDLRDAERATTRSGGRRSRSTAAEALGGPAAAGRRGRPRRRARAGTPRRSAIAVVALDARRRHAAPHPRGGPRRAGRARPTWLALPFRRGGLAAAWARNTYVHLRAVDVPARPRRPAPLAGRRRARRAHALRAARWRAAALFPDDDFPGRWFSTWTDDAAARRRARRRVRARRARGARPDGAGEQGFTRAGDPGPEPARRRRPPGCACS